MFSSQTKFYIEATRTLNKVAFEIDLLKNKRFRERVMKSRRINIEYADCMSKINNPRQLCLSLVQASKAMKDLNKIMFPKTIKYKLPLCNL